MAVNQDPGNDIAVIGMAVRLPGADNANEFWDNLCSGVESLSTFSREELTQSGFAPELLQDEGFVATKGIVKDPELFDAGFFGFNAREAEITDPQHRLFLECAWEALENSGLDPARYDGSIGMYAGAAMNTYLANLLSHPELVSQVGNFQLGIGNDKDFLATRVSYKLNLTGPSFAVQCGCSTSLVAVHLACQSILDGQCDAALAGGVAISFPQKSGYVFREGGVFSPDGHCRAFDAEARGMVPSNGMGIVVLARLHDAIVQGHTVYAVIKGSAINNDGSSKVGYTAPSDLGQTEVIASALAFADIPADSIGYVEAHGTGTPLGDPIEVAGLMRVFQASTNKTGFCGLGSVKTNIGHLDTAAGIAGLVKVIMALRHGKIPPSLHFMRPNASIDFENSPFYVNTELRDWIPTATPRRAGVSSFGIGGTNAHVVLEEFTNRFSEPEASPQLLVLSARTPAELEKATDNLSDYLSKNPEVNLADVAYTLQLGRKAFNCRRAVACETTDEAARLLKHRDPLRVLNYAGSSDAVATAFMFPGQGAQYVRMGEELYDKQPVFRQEMDACAEFVRAQTGLDLREVLYPPAHQLSAATRQLGNTEITQPALFMVEYALAAMWRAYGVVPEVVIGHSLGEFTAACIAGVFSLEDALRLVIVRGALAQRTGKGKMLMVMAAEAEVNDLIRDTDLSLAAINGPGNCVIAGHESAIDAMHQSLSMQGIKSLSLENSNAFHSAFMDPVREEFVGEVAKVTLQPPRIPYISCVTGKRVGQEAANPEFWGKHLRDPVRFADGLKQLGNDRSLALLEVGPGQTLRALARQQLQVSNRVLAGSLRHPKEQESDMATLLKAMGQLWTAGIEPDWRQLYKDQTRLRIALPTYPFNRQRYWIDQARPTSLPFKSDSRAIGSQSDLPGPEAAQTAHERPQLRSKYVKPRTQKEQILVNLWEEFLGLKPVGTQDNFFEMGGDSIVGARIAGAARQYGLQLTAGQIFECQTIEELATMAKMVATHGHAGERFDLDGEAPLSPMQQWFFEQDFRDPSHWNQCVLLDVRQPYSSGQLHSVLQAIFAHHAALRLLFAKRESEWMQIYHDDTSLPYSLEDLSAISPQERAAHIEKISTEAQASLDIFSGPLIRVVAFTFDGIHVHRVLIIIHHLIIDIGSWQVLLEDLTTATSTLGAFSAAFDPVTSRATSFTFWCDALREYSRSISPESSLNISRSMVRQRYTSVSLDHPSGTNDVASVARLAIQLSAEETKKMNEVCAKHRLRPQHLVLAGIMLGLSGSTGGAFLFEMECDGREIAIPNVDVSRTVGWFTVSYPAFVQLIESQDTLHRILDLKKQLEQVNRQNPTLSLLRSYHSDADVRRELSLIPAPQISLVYLGRLDQMLPESASFVRATEPTGPHRSPRGKRLHVLDFEAQITDARMSIMCSYSSNLHNETRIAEMMNQVATAVREMISQIEASPRPHYLCSDFPDVDLNQKELDQIVSYLKR